MIGVVLVSSLSLGGEGMGGKNFPSLSMVDDSRDARRHTPHHTSKDT
jgi:hypothetical protein